MTAPTLTEALQRARALHGDDACVVDSRTVTVREEDGLGQRRLVEVLVAPPGSVGRGLGARRTTRRSAEAGPDLATALAGEVERIEQLVATLAGARTDEGDEGSGYPLASALLRAGASPAAVERAASLFARQPAADRGDATAAMTHLRGMLRASGSDWAQWGGVHVFLGEAGCGKTDLVLGAAAQLRAARLRPLVLSLLPRHGGEIRHLQIEAAQHGYDAAVMHRPEQFIRNATHLDAYDTVLVDTPALSAEPFATAGDLHAFIADNAVFHRHVVLPADADLREEGELWEAARRWNCDWMAVTKLDRTRRPGKLLDLIGRLSCPFSLMAEGAWPGVAPQLARPDALAARILAGEGNQSSAATA